MRDEVAVVGAGMFGSTIALELAKRGAAVTLFEKGARILPGASRSNQWRLHRGYHYPQSVETAQSCLRSEPKFRAQFDEAVLTDRTHYYAIADESWVSPEEYTRFCDELDLAYERVSTDLVDEDTVSEVLQVEENHVDAEVLAEILRERLQSEGVDIELGTEIKTTDELSGYDTVVIATYAHMNELLDEDSSLRREYRFEICELPLVELPTEYHGNNIIIVYGPFMSVDHWGRSDSFLMGDYHNMVHASNVGTAPEIPDPYDSLINRGVITDPQVTNFDDFKSLGQKYISGVAESTHLGSMFTIRTKLPDVEDTDARPTVVEQECDVITVFGGKLATSVETAETVADTIQSA
jgi:hypothetical protein